MTVHQTTQCHNTVENPKIYKRKVSKIRVEHPKIYKRKVSKILVEISQYLILKTLVHY